MNEPVALPIKTNQIEACMLSLERSILSGEWATGARLPAEHNLALQYGVSRPAVRKALLMLAARGVVEIMPRRGVYVADYHANGSLALASSLIACQQGNLNALYIHSLREMRLVIECEIARLAAMRRTEQHLLELKRILAAERQMAPGDTQALTEMDFLFHRQVAVASGNLLYPLAMNSYKAMYTGLTGMFFSLITPRELQDVITNHAALVHAIERKLPNQASELMRILLMEGDSYLTENPKVTPFE